MPKWTDKNMQHVLDRASEKALRKIGIVIAGQSILMVPVQTGRLRGSITYATARERTDAKIKGDGVSQPKDKDTVHIGSNVEYSNYVEFGTKYMGAQPFLRPAFDRNKKNVSKIFANEIKAAFRGK